MSHAADGTPPAPQLPPVRLKIERRSSHPWIFQKMVEKPATRIPPGSVVEVLDRDGNWVGRGFYNGHSRISLRILTSRSDEPVDAGFFGSLIDRAVSLRRDWLKLDAVTDAYRLVHSEGDSLSGLVVDRFGDTLVMEFFSAGMFKQRDVLRDALLRHYPDSKVIWFADQNVQKQESFDCRPADATPAVVIREHGVRFRVAPGGKHKTGFFTDQRENRRLLASMCDGKSVLDLCCNTGGFAVYAKAIGGATDVTGVDLDEVALDLARQNAGLNKANIRWVQADIFTWLRDTAGGGTKWDVVILDPAKQTRDREEVPYALKRYYDMNKLALGAVAVGGLFVTCSCTGLVSEQEFLESVRRAAWQAGKSLQILDIRGAGADHPVLMHVPESRYLKAVFCRVLGA
ncbi:MAG: class I SAM-dependent rRNA methyltransferase [Gemmataceae bacterium]|nr:class I SAM-dependent rRNA methyltransferase [Gemmataceae bacterium]